MLEYFTFNTFSFLILKSHLFFANWSNWLPLYYNKIILCLSVCGMDNELEIEKNLYCHYCLDQQLHSFFHYELTNGFFPTRMIQYRSEGLYRTPDSLIFYEGTLLFYIYIFLYIKFSGKVITKYEKGGERKALDSFGKVKDGVRKLLKLWKSLKCVNSYEEQQANTGWWFW